MAELLVRVIDKTNPNDIYKDAKLMKRGDVVCIVPDGWTWGKEELSNPEWRIVKVPGVNPADLSSLTARQPSLSPRPVLSTGIEQPNVLRARAFSLNLDHPALASVASMINEARKVGALQVDLSVLTTVQITKPYLSDPTVFGDAPHVIG